MVDRVARQHARAVAASDAVRAAAEARLYQLKLDLQPETISRSLDDIRELMLVDVEAANNRLVSLAEHLEESFRRPRVQLISIGEELEK